MLAPWLGPVVLPQHPTPTGATIATTTAGVIIAQTTHHSITY